MRIKWLRLKRGRVDVAAEEEGQGLLLLQQQQPQTCHNDNEEEQQHQKPSSEEEASRHLVYSSHTNNTPTLPSLQVVILKAWIDCHGCEKRVKKAIRKMEGVNTFNVDVKEKKVTVIGRICPSAALECVKKVIKNVEFWESPQPNSHS